MNKLVKTCSKKDLYFEFLKALNGIIQLPNRELELLSCLIELQVNKPNLEGYHENVISAENRKYLTSKTGITPDNLSRYFSKFKELGFLVKGKIDGQWLVNKILIPELIKDRVQISIILKVNEE